MTRSKGFSRVFRRPAHRRAVVLMSVLVCLSVAMMLFLVWLRTAALEQSQLRAQQDRLQAGILADAGLDRAAAQLRSAAGYSGEIWQIGADAFAGRGGAAVVISIESAPEKTDSRIVHSVAEYPLGSESLVRRSKQVTVVLSKTGEAP